ncbi:MAG TPA: anti-sigma factor [Anaerolineales bacterium]|nr:anti-sigma factor [Anaerolineales bacterium]
MDKDIEELLPFYALDALTEEERVLVEEYLTEHPEARRQIETMSETVSALPLSVAPVKPSRQTKEALMARVNADAKARARSSAQSQPSRRAIRFESFFRTLSFGAALAAIIWAIVLNVQVSHLQKEIATLNDALVAQSKSLNQVIAKLPQATPSDVITVSLKGTKVQPQAQGQLIADPSSQSAVLVITGLPPLQPGKTYQVWLIGGAPVSAGLLTVNQDGQGVIIVTSKEAIGSFKSLGISIEPEGGSPQPTGDIVVLSDL